VDEPSAQLVALLERLRLVTAGQLLSHRPQVRRLAGELGFFDTVWIDALVQSRQLTPFQAREINAGRGDALQVGPMVLVRPEASFGFAECFAARHIESGESVRLYLMRRSLDSQEAVERELAALAQRGRDLARRRLLPILTTGADASWIWAATPACSAKSAADWMIENGRFSPDVVLFIAQEMAAALAELGARSIVHGDISAASLLIERGRVLLAHPGLRGIVRPAEGYAHHELFPSAYDYLAPERIASGTSPSVAGDVYACGALWWHLLTGRSPFAGGNSLTKLQSVHAARTVDVRRLAPETPEPLVVAISHCLSREPSERPSNFAELAAALGSPTRHGGAALTRLMNERQKVRSVLGSGPAAPRGAVKSTKRALTAVTVAALLIVACWPAWRRRELFARFSPGGGNQAVRSQVALASGAPRPAALPDAEPAGKEATSPGATRRTDRSVAAVAYWAEQQAPALVLPADRPLTLDRLSLRPGQLVRGEPGTRPKILVPPRGLTVAVEDVTFENIDFVADSTASKSQSTGGMIAVSAARAQFHGCTFRGDEAADRHRSAIAWRGQAQSRQSVAEGTGEIVVRNCVVGHLAAAIEVAGPARYSIVLANSLFANCGAVVRMRRTANFDPSGDLLLEHVTARETGPVVYLDCESTRTDNGLLTITANESTFALGDGAPLLLVSSESPLESPGERIEWQGQGSLVTSATPVAAWRPPDGQLQPIADEQLSVAGLVRSQVQFAGQMASDSAASRTVRWQVPLQSAEPPGIGDDLP
jgi:hypothetical protein